MGFEMRLQRKRKRKKNDYICILLSYPEPKVDTSDIYKLT